MSTAHAAATLAIAFSLVSVAATAQVSRSYGLLPTAFEENHGQRNAEVKFLAKGSGYELFLTRSGPVLCAHAAADVLLRWTLRGATAAPVIEGTDRLPGAVNYLIGKSAAQWHTKIPIFAAVRYRAVYTGIDVIYHSAGRLGLLLVGALIVQRR